MRRQTPPASLILIRKLISMPFRSAGINAVLDREGDVICILASEMPMDELLALARSKAKPS